MPLVVKKYSNRRLYDTEESCYITLDGLMARLRAGADVGVGDAKTGDGLPQGTVTPTDPGLLALALNNLLDNAAIAEAFLGSRRTS